MEELSGRSMSDGIERPLLVLRLEAAKEAIKRARFAFLASTIVSLAMTVTAYNAYLSWDKSFAMQDTWPGDRMTSEAISDGVAGRRPPDNPTVEAQRHLIEEWVRSQAISVQLLGIHVGVSDLAILGAFSLFIISVWFFLGVKREHRAIAFLLDDTAKASPDIRKVIFHLIASYMVFADLGEGEYRGSETGRTGSSQPRLLKRNSIRLFRWFEGRLADWFGTKFSFRRLIIWFLYYFPVLAIGFVVLMDTLSVFWFDAPYRIPHTPLRTQMHSHDWVEFLIFELVAVILMIITHLASTRTLRVVHQIDEKVGEYRIRFEDDLNEEAPKEANN